MIKLFNYYPLFIINFLKYFSVILIFFCNNKIIFLTKICSFLKNIIFSIILFLLFIALFYYCYDQFYNNDIINNINISYDNKHNNPNYDILNIFSNKPNYYFPSCFVKNEFLDANFTFLNMNSSIKLDTFSETENYYLLKQSYALCEIKRCNNEIISMYNKLL
jgi:hypothetical protein